jgi:hypothetical protein
MYVCMYVCISRPIEQLSMLDEMNWDTAVMLLTSDNYLLIIKAKEKIFYNFGYTFISSAFFVFFVSQWS